MDDMQTTAAPVSAAPVPVPSRPMLPGTGKLLKEVWGDYAQRFWTYIGIYIIPTLVTILLVILGVGGALVGQGAFRSSYLVAGGGVIVLIIAVIAAVIIYLWSAVALLYAMLHSGENVGIKESFRQTWRKIGSYIWISLISGVLIWGGFMFFAIPGIIFSMWFLFAFLVFLNEGDRGFQALLKSREYVRNYWWAVFGRLILMGLIFLGIFIVFGILTGILAVALKNFGGTSAILQILQQVLIVIVTPFAMLFEVKIYTNLKALKGQVVLGDAAKKDKKIIAWFTILGYVVLLAIIILPIIAIMRR